MGSSDRVTAATSAIETALDTLVTVDLDMLPAATLTGLVRSIARAEARMAGLTARAAAAADRAGAIDAAGAPSTASWLADTTGGTTHSAARTVSLGRALDAAPAVAEGLADGTLAADKASTLARALDRGVLDARDIDALVSDARSLPAGVFAREVRAREAAADNDRLRGDERWARERRTLTHRRRDDGSLEGRFLVDPLAGDTVVKALRALTTRDPSDTAPEDRRTRAQRDADALVEIARHALDAGAGVGELNVRPHVSVVVPAAALEPDGEDAVAAGVIGTTDQDTMISVHAIRTLLCDAAVRRIVVDPEGRPLDVGRATRSWSGAQRAASAALDGGCRGPACDRPFAWTQLHHIDWWTHGGHTDLDRAVPLCHHCHHLVHDDGWQVELDPSTRIATWTSPGGLTTTTYPRGPAAPSRLTAPATSSAGSVGYVGSTPSGAGSTATDDRSSADRDDRSTGGGAERRPRESTGRPRRHPGARAQPDIADEPKLFAPP